MTTRNRTYGVTSRRRPRRRGATLLSTVLFVAALAFAGAAVYLYLNDRGVGEGPSAPPAAESGLNEAANVMEGLKAAGLHAEYGRYTATADQLTPPGQAIELDDADLYIFIYVADDGATAIADREADASDLDPATVTLTSRSAERPLTEGRQVNVFGHSNIVGILVGGDAELVEQVGSVIASLP